MMNGFVEAGLPTFSQKWVLLPLFTSFWECLFIGSPLSLSDPFKRRYQKHVLENRITFWQLFKDKWELFVPFEYVIDLREY